MSTVKERTCDSPASWKAARGRCHCHACRDLYNEYQRKMYQARQWAKANPHLVKKESLDSTEIRWRSQAVLGLATRCPMCAKWTKSKSGFCKRHDAEEARI